MELLTTALPTLFSGKRCLGERPPEASPGKMTSAPALTRSERRRSPGSGWLWSSVPAPALPLVPMAEIQSVTKKEKKKQTTKKKPSRSGELQEEMSNRTYGG